MRNTYYEIYIHVVWCVKNREQAISKEIEELIYPILIEKAESKKASIIAIGNTMDHMHILLSISPQTNIAILIKEMKGTTSYFTNHKTKETLYWQDGYGIFSISKTALGNVKRYVENQKEHHAMKKNLIPTLEMQMTD